MARPKANTKEGQEATRKWHETMLKRYGSEEALKEAFRIQGAKGGRNGFTGGFYVNRELAKIAGKKGGSISKRGQANSEIWNKVKDEAYRLYNLDVPMTIIAKKLDIKYSLLVSRLREGRK